MGEESERNSPAPDAADDRPVTPRGAWTRAEMADFLDSTTVPIRLGCTTPAGGLWMLSLWYRYRDGAFHCATSASADVVTYLDADDRVSFEISVNEPPTAASAASATRPSRPTPGRKSSPTCSTGISAGPTRRSPTPSSTSPGRKSRSASTHGNSTAGITATGWATGRSSLQARPSPVYPTDSAEPQIEQADE